MRLLTIVCLALVGCIPKLESSTRENPYPLQDFNGPSTVPGSPAGTFSGFDLKGPWKVVDVQHQDGDPAGEHLLEPGWYLQANEDRVDALQGVPPEWFLPSGLEWTRNSVDRERLVLGFGFGKPRGDLNFLHYAFVMAGVDDNHARGIEALHFENAALGTIVWSIWSVQLERVQRPPDVIAVPVAPVWPR